jgi:sulfur carrier protein
LGATLQDAIALTPIAPPFAAAVNAQFVPKTLYEQTLLNDNDKIELIVPITGG